MAPARRAGLEDGARHVPLQQVNPSPGAARQMRELMDEQALARSGKPGEEHHPTTSELADLGREPAIGVQHEASGIGVGAQVASLLSRGDASTGLPRGRRQAKIRRGGDKSLMDKLDQAIRDVVIGNRILAHEGVVDAYGHVSVRHPRDPGRYFLSRSRAPELVELGDVIEYDLSGTAVAGETRAPYLERFIHGAIYEARPDVQAVVHAHAEAVLPFTITPTPLRPVMHMASFIGARLPVWGIRDRFGATNLLVVNMAPGRDLARTLGAERAVLMRGHG